jgi:hypothetical protein
MFNVLFLSHILCGEFSSQRRVIDSLPFLSAPTFYCCTAAPGRSRSCRSLTLSDVPDERTADVFAGRRNTYFQFLRCVSKPTSFVGVTRAPKYTHFLTTSKFLSPKATVCPASRIVLFPATIMYFVFCSLIFCLTFVVSSTSLKNSVDNTSPCLSSCRVFDTTLDSCQRCFGVVCCLEVYEEMISCNVELVVFFPESVAERTAGLLLTCLSGNPLGNAVLPRLRRVIGGYAVIWRRLYTLHSV